MPAISQPPAFPELPATLAARKSRGTRAKKL
jgi:hypothetical protein